MNKKGSAMVWAAVSMVIIMILALGIITAGQAYALRSTNEGSQKQAYLTARSAVDSILSQLDGYTSTGSSEHPSDSNPLIPVSGSIDITGFDFPAEMGECTASITRESDTVLKVSASATVGDAVETVCARLLLGVDTVAGGGGTFTATETLRGFSVNGTLTVPASGYFYSTNSDFYINDIQEKGQKNYSFYVGSGKLYSDLNTTGNRIKGHPISFSTKTKQPYNATPLPSNIQLDEPESFTETKVDLFLLDDYYSLGYIWNDSVSYKVISDTEHIDTRVGGNGTYYIKVTPGNTLYLNLVNWGTSPKVYVFLDESTSAGDAELIINSVASGITLFVVGGTGSKVSTTGYVSMSGAIAADDITLDGSLSLTYVSPSSGLVLNDAGGSGGSGPITSYTDTWSFDEYAAE